MMRAAESLVDRALGRPVASAFVVPVPEAANVVALADPTARTSGELPPHITLLYPLPPIHRLDRRAVGDVTEALRTISPFNLRFEHTDRFPEVLYLAPTPPEPLVALTTLLAERFPEHPPYGGAFDEIIPHLSVVAHAHEAPGLEAAVHAHLPFECNASEVWLASLERSGSWSAAERFILGGTSAVLP
jgi:2'-5' RNA ligase superfamily